MAQKPKAVVNLDALIQRADLAAPGEAAEDIADISILDLDPKGFLYPALRKPDFQRETAGWTPEQVADLIATFARRDLIPAVILWRAGQNVFVIDGAHRLSALIAWVHDDYGDKDISRKFFQDDIPDEQIKAAERTRELVVASIGSYSDHRKAIEKPAEAIDRATEIEPPPRFLSRRSRYRTWVRRLRSRSRCPDSRGSRRRSPGQLNGVETPRQHAPNRPPSRKQGKPRSIASPASIGTPALPAMCCHH